MSDLDGEDMAIMARFKPRPAHSSATGRRAAEARPVHHVDGRRARATGRNAQLNLKVRHEFRERVLAVSQHLNMMMVELIERAVEEYIERQGL